MFESQPCGSNFEISAHQWRSKPSRPWKRKVIVVENTTKVPVTLEFSAKGKNVMVWSGDRFIGEFSVRQSDWD